MGYFNKIFINGLQIQGDNCPYFANLFNFLFDSSNTNNDSELYSDGSYNGTSKINSKTITLVVGTKNDNDIKAGFQLTHVISKGEVPLIVEVENLGTIECNVKKESITTDDFGIMTIALKLCDPYLYSRDYKEITLEKVIEGGWKFPTSPFNMPTSWTYTEAIKGDLGECINNGYATVYPLLEIEGEGSDFKIYNLTTGEILKIDYRIDSGQILLVDCKPSNRCVKVNGTSIIKYKSGNYISLINGSNEIKVDYTGECSVKVRWKEAWI